MYNQFSEFLKDKKTLTIIQAENPDGDSVGSALGLMNALKDHAIDLYCPVDIPKYLRYFEGSDFVTNDFNFHSDGYIIVDTAASVLLSKLLADPAIKNALYDHPVLVLDHHETPDDLDFPHTAIIETRPACCDLIYQILTDQGIAIPKPAAEALLQGIMSDTLGLTSSSVTSETFRTAAALIDLGANISELEENRREFMKKSPRILDYKADLIHRIDYSLDNELATVHISWDDIREYSDEYNPNVLILEEMRLVEGVRVAIAIKTYPDGKLTGKIRTSANTPIADQIAGYYGGGGHPCAAGFRTYDLTYEQCLEDLSRFIPDLLAAHPLEEKKKIWSF